MDDYGHWNGMLLHCKFPIFISSDIHQFPLSLNPPKKKSFIYRKLIFFFIFMYYLLFRIIYSLLRNSHIDSTFKRRLQRAALFGYDHTASTDGGGTLDSDQAPISFVPVCDREFACPRSVVP